MAPTTPDPAGDSSTPAAPAGASESAAAAAKASSPAAKATPARRGARGARAGADIEADVSIDNGTSPRARTTKGSTKGEDPTDLAAGLTFRQAQAALELCISQLQASDLDVERMGDLHRRAEACAERCEQLLREVEQDVMQWDPTQPDAPAALLEP